MNYSGRPFKISILVHSASLKAFEGGGLMKEQRPYVAVTVGDKTKETELGDWCREKGQWVWSEAITVEVKFEDEISVYISSKTRYDLWVASIAMTSREVGEVCFPVSSVLPRLRMEDRDMDGIVYATPPIGFDAVLDGKHAGKVYLSFETKQAPPSRKAAGPDGGCCIFDGGRLAFVEVQDPEDSDLDSTCRSAYRMSRSDGGSSYGHYGA